MSMVVAKFGGSSVKDADAMRRCASIVKENPDIRVVILSATYNTTNHLEEMSKLALDGNISEAVEILTAVKERHYQIAEELGADKESYYLVDTLVGEGESLLRGITLLKECSDRAMDRLYSIGERMSSALFCGVLRSHISDSREISLVDAREIIKTNSDFRRAIPSVEKIKKQCQSRMEPLLEKGHVVVTQGFIGSDDEGAITTLGREGSDFSAALIAEGISASKLQIWTDVTGIYSTDPRLVSSAKKIDELKYSEARTMAHLGAKVLYPETLAPAMRKGIPVYVGSSLQSDVAGTWIRENLESLPRLRAVAKTDEHWFYTLKDKFGRPHCAFHKAILDVLSRNRIPYESVFATTDGVNVLFGEKVDLSSEVIDDLKSESNVCERHYLSRVSIIGNDLEKEPGLISNVMELLGDNEVNIFKFNGGADFLSFYVDTSDAKELLARLHCLI